MTKISLIRDSAESGNDDTRDDFHLPDLEYDWHGYESINKESARIAWARRTY
jgi:hypothetical protein